jgi:hypothetical protein
VIYDIHIEPKMEKPLGLFAIHRFGWRVTFEGQEVGHGTSYTEAGARASAQGLASMHRRRAVYPFTPDLPRPHISQARYRARADRWADPN